jgi:hypothetical protein
MVQECTPNNVDRTNLILVRIGQRKAQIKLTRFSQKRLVIPNLQHRSL